MFYSIPNWVSSTATPMEKPWEYNATSVPETVTTKEEWMKWAALPTTRHAFISGFEGITPTIRASDAPTSDNPVHSINAIIVDYDALADERDIERIRSNPKSEFLPAYYAGTFQGRGRLIWLLEKPLVFTTQQQVKKFMSQLDKKLKFANWLRGWDQEAIGDPKKYYEIGTNWTPLWPDYKISNEHMFLWLYEASKDLQLAPKQYNIPLDVVFEQVKAQFPGRWTGAFEQGSRGIRFWDSTADNPTGAKVHTDGMMYFTRGGGFMSWRQIFGSAFVEKYEAEKVTDVLSSVYFEGPTNKFWCNDGPENTWRDSNLGSFQNELKCKGFSAKPVSKGGASEVDRARLMVEKERRVEAAMPYVHFPSGPIRPFNCDAVVLNTSTAKVLAPAPDTIPFEMLPAQGFPWLWSFLSNLFDRRTDVHSRDLQLEHLLVWLKHAYMSYLKQEPQPGQIMIIAGGPSTGKTFLLQRVIGPLLGGVGDGVGVTLEGSQWSETICRKPVIALDDALVPATLAARQEFSARLKRFVANPVMSFNAKFKQAGEVLWYGRFVILCNVDSESGRMIPDPENSMADKLSMLLCKPNGKFQFGDMPENNANAARELPFFARWLMQWKIPDHWLNMKDRRYYVKSYKHPVLFRASLESGTTACFSELLSAFMLVHQASDPALKDDKLWHGTATDLHYLMSQWNPHAMRHYGVQYIGTLLAKMENSNMPVASKRSRNGREWVIHYDIASAELAVDGCSYHETEEKVDMIGITTVDSEIVE